MKTLGELAKELLHSAATASNDDVSAPMTEERRRHSARLEAMREAAERLEAIGDIWGRYCATINAGNLRDGIAAYKELRIAIEGKEP